MRKIFLFMMTSLDGYFEGEGHDLSWHNVDAEFDNFANRQLYEADTLVFGHTTYKLMASYWPTHNSADEPSETAIRMNKMKKIVFSRKSLNPNWEHTTAYTDLKQLRDFKRQPGKSIAVLGSSNLCISLLKENLLDEIRIMINPIVLGNGTPLFKGIDKLIIFQFESKRSFKNGNVLLNYKI